MEYQKVTNMLRLFEEQMKDFDLAKDAQRVYNKFTLIYYFNNVLFIK